MTKRVLPDPSLRRHERFTSDNLKWEKEWNLLQVEASSFKSFPACPKDRSSLYVPVRETLCQIRSGSYINANRVCVAGCSFIATQEPISIGSEPKTLTNTENDFWALVWEQKVSVIICLISDDAHYLPEKEKVFGNLVVVSVGTDKWITGYPIRVREFEIHPQVNKSSSRWEGETSELV
eukprot:TRINITY_DN3031_c0_g2_i5.p1 TRINITY_DN3031_c0_g2~~TRINITY_DN3031_c0_g2_i5.p1  ORF type:complete len:179 (+),score=30.21 TRINITY_DN3031_c0_g2_i5:173-709(+)